jgi:cell division GTPase FtsZ
MDRRQFLSAVALLGCDGVIASPGGESRLGFSRSLNLASPVCNEHATVDQNTEGMPKVGIVTVGSAGGWILNCQQEKLPWLHRTIAIDTCPLLSHGKEAGIRVLIGGCFGSNPAAAEMSVRAKAAAGDIARAIEGLDQVFILADMEDAIEQDLAIVAANATLEKQVMTIGVAITSFFDRGNLARQVAQDGIQRLAKLGIPTVSLLQKRDGRSRQGLFGIIPSQMEQATAFERLYRSTVLIHEGGKQSVIWLDQDEVRATLSQNGFATMVIGYGSANGFESGRLAAHRAISHSLFDANRNNVCIELLVHIEALPGCLTYADSKRALNVVSNAFPNSHLLFGMSSNPLLDHDSHVTVVAPMEPWTNRSG